MHEERLMAELPRTIWKKLQGADVSPSVVDALTPMHSLQLTECTSCQPVSCGVRAARMQPIPELLAMATVNIFSLDNRSNTSADSNSRGCQPHCELFLRWWS